MPEGRAFNFSLYFQNSILDRVKWQEFRIYFSFCMFRLRGLSPIDRLDRFFPAYALG